MAVIILGGGPAGISAALYTARAGLETTVIAKDGGALRKAEKIENYYGFPGGISGQELLHNGTEQAKQLGVRFIAEEAVGLGFGESLFVSTATQDYPAQAVILASGSTRNTPKIDGIRALEGKGISYCAVCDAFFYRNKPVAVIGNGAYALHEVQELLPVVGSVTLFTNGAQPEVPFPENLPIVTTPLAAFAGEQQLEEIRLADGSCHTVSGAFIAVGVAGSADLAKKIGALTDGNNIVVNEKMETNIPGLYAAGDCTGGTLQIAKAVFEGMTAGMQAIRLVREKNSLLERTDNT